MSDEKEQGNDPWLGAAVPPDSADAKDSQTDKAEGQESRKGSNAGLFGRLRGKMRGEKATSSSSENPEHWERKVIEKLVLGLFREQRKTRRWNMLFKGLMFAYLLMLFFIYMPDTGDTGVSMGKHTALIDISGVIAADAAASADSVISGLRTAFKNKGTAGVIIRINSPGGSPVQAGYINDEIGRLRAEYPDIPLYAVITDICASGGYYIAVAADHIYADKASIVGSIGVLMDGFGFVDAMNKLGIERRLLTAGEHKGFLDPFSPMNKMEKQHVESLLGNIHQQFIATVKKGRGDRLRDNDELFSGLVWSGEQSVGMGLIDGLGSSSYVAREVIGVEKIVDFTSEPPLLERFIERLGVTMANTLSSMAGKIR
jgi:protease-4